MDFQFADRNKPLTERLWQTLWLAAILWSFAAMLDWLAWVPYLLPGLALPFLPGRYQSKILWGILCGGLLYACVRWECMGFLLNRLFAMSEAVQSYEYDYFTVSVTHPGEGFALLSLMAGALTALWGNGVNLALTAVLGLSVAYFGVAPGIFWLAVLTAVAGCSLCRQKTWFSTLLIAGMVLLTALLVTWLVPAPMASVSELDEGLRDTLSANSVFYTHTPVPNPVPAPVPVPPPPETGQQPDRGIMGMAVNLLFLLFSVITLGLLFIPAVIKDRAQKKRRANRAFLEETDNGAAIRGMYLYAKKWRALDAAPEDIPADVAQIWLEAAYSQHPMTDAQKERMRTFVRSSAEKVWREAGRKKKLRIQYQDAL